MRNYIPPKARLVPDEAEEVFAGVIYKVYQWQQQMFDDSYATFEMLKRPDTVKVLAVHDNKLIILHQEQPSYDPFYDIPGGRHDYENETELEAAQRETLEETGMVFKNWKLISAVQTFSNIESFLYMFIASDLRSQGAQKLDAGEKIEVIPMDFEAVKELGNRAETRFMPTTLLDEINSIEELLALPAVA
jgi:8-oxo-dGTP pyrophosphatase MutT (NUDIX family)